MYNEIALIEELAANAVVPLMTQDVDGWRLRYSEGVTRRANSVFAARHSGTTPVAEKIALAEAFYGRRGVLCRFQLCPASRPDDLDAVLAERGYSLSPPTYVQTAAISDLLDAAAARADVDESFSEPWLQAYVEGEGETSPAKIASRRAMLQRIAPQAGFVSVEEHGQLAAVTLGVVERGWLGIFNTTTRPRFRRRGLALAAIGDLAEWARGYGATRAYLQVFSTNTAALRLYSKLGFSTLYEYRYRERDLAAP